MKCPDGGQCHHDCKDRCWRVDNAGPFSGVYPGNRWPDDVDARPRIEFNPKQAAVIKNIGPKNETAFLIPNDLMEKVRETVAYQQFKLEFEAVVWMLGHPGAKPADLVLEVDAPRPGVAGRQVLKVRETGEVVAEVQELALEVTK